MGYRSYTRVWVGMDTNDIMQMIQNQTEFVDFLAQHPDDIQPQHEGYDWAFHHYATTKAYNYICIERELPNHWHDWAMLFVGDLDILIAVPCSLNVNNALNHSLPELRPWHEYGWGLQVCNDLGEADDPKAVYDRAEELKEVYKQIVTKYFDDEQEIKMLLDNMDVHTAAIEE